MSYLKNGIKLAALVYIYKLIDDESKKSIKNKVKEKIIKYKPILLELIDLIDSFEEGFQNLRHEDTEFKKNFNLLANSLELIDEDEIQNDVDDIANTVVKIFSSKNKKIILSKNKKD